MIHKKSYRDYRMWKKEDLKKLIGLWDTTSLQEAAESLGAEQHQIRYIVSAMRKAGIPLAKKHKNGHLNVLLTELKEELGI